LRGREKSKRREVWEGNFTTTTTTTATTATTTAAAATTTTTTTTHCEIVARRASIHFLPSAALSSSPLKCHVVDPVCTRNLTVPAAAAAAAITGVA